MLVLQWSIQNLFCLWETQRGKGHLQRVGTCGNDTQRRRRAFQKIWRNARRHIGIHQQGQDLDVGFALSLPRVVFMRVGNQTLHRSIDFNIQSSVYLAESRKGITSDINECIDAG